MKNLPHWARLLLIIIALVLAAGLILPYFLDVDRYRSFVATLIETRTGRKVRIGKIRARLLPSVGFVVEDFGLRNPPGFAEGDVLSAQAIRGNLAWGPLLHREFRLSSVELVRPKFMLLEDDLGQTNYGSSPGRGPGVAEKSGPRLSQPPSETAGIDRVELTDAEVIVARLAPKARDTGALIPTVHASRIRAELSHLVLDPLPPKQWEAHANLSGVALELPGWKGPITLRSGQLQLRNGSVESEFRVSLGKAADFKGTLHVADIEHGVAVFELSTPQLDVDEALTMQEKTPPHSSVPRPRQSELLAKGRLSVEHVRWKPYAASKATAEVRIFSDRVELWPVGLEIYGGMLQISARADRTQTPERFSSNVQVRNLNMGELLSASPATRGKLSGTGELNLQLFGSLDNDWQKSLSGTGQFAIRDGRLPGINLAGALESAAKLAGMSGETPFTVIQGDLTISQRRITSRQIHVDSPHGTVDLHGSTSLDGALDYDGQAVWAPGVAAPGGQGASQAVGAILGGVLRRDVQSVTLPIAIRGTLQDPKFYPGRGAPRVQSPPPQPGLTPPQKDKGILDLFRRP